LALGMLLTLNSNSIIEGAGAVSILAGVIFVVVAARPVIAFIQAAVIIFRSALLFNVNWGQPLGVAAVVILFSLVGFGAGICLGTLLRNEQQAMGVSVLAGMGLAALGGCMVPLELFFRHHEKRRPHHPPRLGV
jgi:linearmycin/streptolysin S transport system permease protein